jgi:phosphoesterase RecJ-like protein
MTTSTPAPTPEQERALAVFREGQRFLLCGHVRPDGDCIGAQAALCRVLRAMGKEVRILNPDPPEPQLDYLARECDYEVHAGGPVPEHDVSVILDISELSRCGGLAAPLRDAKSRKVVVDHHVHVGDEWWDAAFVDVTASSTGLLVWRIARALGVELDPVAAAGVFTSIVTDTGWFKYSNTDAETLEVTAELVRAGVDPSELFRSIYQRSSAGQPRAIGSILRRLEYHADNRLATVDWPRDWIIDGSLDDTDFILDIVRAVETVQVVLFVRELDDGTCKLSARSKTDDYDVQELAREFGGGGHRRAAGATVKGSLAELKPRFIGAALSRFDPLPVEPAP